MGMGNMYKDIYFAKVYIYCYKIVSVFLKMILDWWQSKCKMV